MMFNMRQAALSVIVISAILVASFFAISLAQEPLAQASNMTNATMAGNATSAGNMTNATTAGNATD